MDMIDADLYLKFMGVAGLLALIAVVLAMIEWVRRNIEKSRQEKEVFDRIENMDTKALLGIERELKGIRSSLRTIELVYGFVIFFVILGVVRMIL